MVLAFFKLDMDNMLIGLIALINQQTGRAFNLINAYTTQLIQPIRITG